MGRVVKKPQAWMGVLILAVGLLGQAVEPQVPSGTWVPTGAMSQVHGDASAALLTDGTVLIAGGDVSGIPSASVERYDINAGSFSAAAPMEIARSRHVSVVLQDGRVLVAGGKTTGGEISRTGEIYDPAGNSWSAAGQMAEARFGHTASLLLDGRVLIAGGQNSGGVVASLEIFDPSTNVFTAVGMLSEPRTNHAAAVLHDGRVLIAGGSDGNFALSSVDIFDPATGSVSGGPSLSAFREGPSATTLLDGKVLIVGGHNIAGDEASADMYDPTSNTFSPTTSGLTTARRDHLAFLLPHNNNVLIVGGTADGTALSSVELFAPWQGTFSPTGSMSVARAGAAGSPLNADGLLLIAGDRERRSAELYGFATVKTDQPDYAPGETVTITGSGWQPDETVSLLLQEVPKTHDDRTLSAVADASGHILNNEFQPELHDIGVTFYLTATGAGSQAQTKFLDVAKIEYSFFEGEIAPQGSDNWTTGNVSGYKEGDTIRFRITLSSLTTGQDGHLFVGFTSDPACRFFAFESPTNIAVDFNTATDTVDSGSGFTATFGGLTQSGNDAIADFHLVSSAPSASEVRLNFTLHLSDGAAACATGSSQHVQVDHTTGDIKDSGKKSLPIPASAVAPVTDISVSKSAPASANPGDAISYSITVTNLDPSTAASSVVAADTLPAGVSFVSGSWTKTNPAGSGSCSASGQIVACDIGLLAGAATASVTINVTVNDDSALCDTTQTNNVSVSTKTQDSNTSNNSAQASTDIVCNLALTLAKTADPTSYSAVGQLITYTYKITNAGNVTLAGPFSISDDKQGTISPCGSGPLAPGASTSCTSTHTTTQADLDAGSITNKATASGNDVTSPEASATVTAQKSTALTLEKSASPTTYSAVGQLITYTYKITNAGNVTLAGPFSISDDKQGTISPCGSGPLAPGASTSCTSTHTTTQADLDAGSITNKATASGNGVTSPEASATVTAQKNAALGLVKSASPTTYSAVGQVITYTYTITNTGNVTLSGPFTITDDKAPGAVCPVTLSLTPGASITCTASYLITLADLNAVSVTNTAQGHGFFGTTVVNSNSASATVTRQQSPPQDPVVGLTKTAPSTVKPGNLLDYTVSYTNYGPFASETATITDYLPAGVTFVSASNGGTFHSAGSTVTWNLGTVPAGQTGSVTLRVRVQSTTAVGTILRNNAEFRGSLTVSPPTAVAVTTVVPGLP